MMPSIKFGEGGIVMLGCASGFRLSILALVKGNVNATAYKDIWGKCML